MTVVLHLNSNGKVVYHKNNPQNGRNKKSFRKLHLGQSSLFSLFLLAFIISFTSSLIYFTYPNSVSEIDRLFFNRKKDVVTEYKTYKLGFDSRVSKEDQDVIADELSVMKKDDVKRFSLNRDGKEEGSNTGNFLFTGKLDENDIEVRSSHLLPVGHLYWVKNRIESKDISKLEILVEKGRLSFIRYILESIYPASSLNIKEVDDLASSLESMEGKAVGIIDPNRLSYNLQLLNLNNKYFLDSAEGGIKYSLVLRHNLENYLVSAVNKRMERIKHDGFDRSTIVKINMTGVTAISRSLAQKIDASGDYGYPATKISAFLKDADLTHTSNEVSFAPGCVAAGGMRFCAKPEYIKALEDSGMDIIELTGNHNNDYGATNNANTIATYKSKGWDYFGGGLNTLDAAKILVKEIKGSKVAFVGYNYYDTILGTGALAGDQRAGANSYSVEKLEKDIKSAKTQASVVIVDFQFQECYSYPPSDVIYPICYKPLSSPDQKKVFRKAIDLGADIVIGTQAHQPQTFEIYNGKLIFYGLGNLFFDQIPWIGTRQGLILTHYIQNGKLIQTRVTTTLYDNDMKTYVTTGADRDQLMQLLKNARD